MLTWDTCLSEQPEDSSVSVNSFVNFKSVRSSGWLSTAWIASYTAKVKYFTSLCWMNPKILSEMVHTVCRPITAKPPQNRSDSFFYFCMHWEDGTCEELTGLWEISIILLLILSEISEPYVSFWVSWDKISESYSNAFLVVCTGTLLFCIQK